MGGAALLGKLHFLGLQSSITLGMELPGGILSRDPRVTLLTLLMQFLGCIVHFVPLPCTRRCQGNKVEWAYPSSQPPCSSGQVRPWGRAILF